MTKRAGQRPDNFETELLPKVDRRCISRDNKIELYCAKAKPTRLSETMLTHFSSHSQSARVSRDHEGGISHVRTGTGLIRSQDVGTDDLCIVFCDIGVRVRSKPIT